MKIVAVFQSYRPSGWSGNVGGGEISNRVLLQGLAKRGHDIVVIAMSSGGKSYTEEGVDVVCAKENGINKYGRWNVIKLESKIESLKPDVILTATGSLVAASFVSEKLELPLGTFVRAYENFGLAYSAGFKDFVRQSLKKKIYPAGGIRHLKKSKVIIANSQYMARFCEERIGSDVSVAVVYPPLDVQSYKLKSLGRIRSIAMVGESKKKGIDVFLWLAREFPEIEFRVLGCKDVSSGPGISLDNVHRVGWCDTLKEFYESSDLVLVPSQWPEPFGRVAIEGLSTGKIVLASNVGGLPEALVYERNLLVSSSDLISWKNRINAILGNPEPFYLSALRARDKISTFNSSLQVDSLESVLSSMVEDL